MCLLFDPGVGPGDGFDDGEGIDEGGGGGVGEGGGGGVGEGGGLVDGCEYRAMTRE